SLHLPSAAGSRSSESSYLALTIPPLASVAAPASPVYDRTRFLRTPRGDYPKSDTRPPSPPSHDTHWEYYRSAALLTASAGSPTVWHAVHRASDTQLSPLLPTRSSLLSSRWYSTRYRIGHVRTRTDNRDVYNGEVFGVR